MRQLVYSIQITLHQSWRINHGEHDWDFLLILIGAEIVALLRGDRARKKINKIFSKSISTELVSPVKFAHRVL